MKRRTILAGVIVAVLAVVLLALYAKRQIPAMYHQSYTKELADWEKIYGRPQTWPEAMRSADMLRYVQHYYVPEFTFRSDEATEAALAAQRARTTRTIVTGLKEFTGQDFGEDAERWREWIEKTGEVESRIK